MKIKNIYAREILDSRGNPTVECDVVLDNGTIAQASVPSGASVGQHEAVELRDGDKNRFSGKGVLRVVENIERKIASALREQNCDILHVDKIMREMDGTFNKSSLGANAILPVSIAVTRAQAISQGKEVYELLQELGGCESKVPFAMFNILNGGAHATNNIAFQEFMIMPMHESFAENLHTATSIYHKLRELLVVSSYETGVGDEGGFAPRLKKTNQTSEREALDLLLRATELAGFEPGNDVVFTLDVAASQFFSKEQGKYELHTKKFFSEDLIAEYKQLVNEYPIYSIEDALDEDDWNGWKLLTEDIGGRVRIVGDDIFVSNPSRIIRGIEKGIANTVLIKPNQIGTVSETLEAINICRKHNYEIVISHRSGETCDPFIADLAFGVGAEYFKSGAPARGERVAKYNRMLKISESDR